MNYYRQIVGIGILGLVFVLSGCGSFQGSGAWFRDKSKDYHDSKVTAELEVPDSFELQPKQEDFPVPKNMPLDKKSYVVSIVPPTAQELKEKK